MVRIPSDRSATRPAGHRVLRWSLIVLLLIGIGLLIIALLLPRGPGTAGPGDSTSPGATDAPATPADEDPSDSDPAVDDPSGDPSDDPTDDPTGPGGPAHSDPPPSASPSSDPVTAAPGDLDEDAAAGVISIAIDTPLSATDTHDALDIALADIAVEGYAAELEAQWLELTSQGWSQSGSPHVESLEIVALDSDSDPATSEVIACIDSSDVVTVDAEGAPIGDPAASSPRALHLFTMVQGDDGIWRVSSHSFPNDPSC